jgi:L-rhamnose-H+ transport protein
VLSAVYGFSLDQGQPIAEVAAKYGAGNFQGNVIYLFSNSGAFLSTLLYCIYLHNKERTWKEFALPVFHAPVEKEKAAHSARKERSVTSVRQSVLTLNFVMAALTGLLWYCQFFFYGLGHTRMGAYKFSSWAIHMIMLVLFSSLAGLLLKEWSRSRPVTVRMLASALLVLVTAVIILTYGNYLGGNA